MYLVQFGFFLLLLLTFSSYLVGHHEVRIQYWYLLTQILVDAELLQRHVLDREPLAFSRLGL